MILFYQLWNLSLPSIRPSPVFCASSRVGHRASAPHPGSIPRSADSRGGALAHGTSWVVRCEQGQRVKGCNIHISLDNKHAFTSTSMHSMQTQAHCKRDRPVRPRILLPATPVRSASNGSPLSSKVRQRLSTTELSQAGEWRFKHPKLS